MCSTDTASRKPRRMNAPSAEEKLMPQNPLAMVEFSVDIKMTSITDSYSLYSWDSFPFFVQL